MICKLTKEESAVVNALSDQAFALLSGAVGSAKGLIALTSIPECHKANSILHAALNVALITALNHRMTHGEMKQHNGLNSLRTAPEEIKTLIEDINEIFADVLRNIDPDHDYLLNLFKVEKSGKGKGDQGQTA